MNESAGNVARRSVAAGFLIGIGCAANATVGGIAGAILFSTALVLIVTSKLPLFTGVIGFVADERGLGRAGRSLIWNLAGAFGAALLFGVSQFGDGAAIVSAQVAANAKFTEPLGAFFVQAVLCGVLVHTAVKSYLLSSNIAPVVMCVAAFILCGYEHCVADAFIIPFATEGEAPTAVCRIAAAVVGNALGAWFIEIHTRIER